MIRVLNKAVPHVSCQICGKNFYTKPRCLKIGWGKFCSRACQYPSQRTGREVVCTTCRKSIYRTPKHFRHSVSGNFFCDKSCSAIWKNQHLIIGENHARWKNGKNAYRNIIKRGGVAAVCNRCREDDFRILLVHHIDGNRQNNVLDNLMWLCYNCHFLIHHYNDERKKLMASIA